MAESSAKGQKTLWEKVKLLVMSNFTFSHSLFKSLGLQTCLFGKVLTPFLQLRPYHGCQ